MKVQSYKSGSKTFYSCRFWYYKNGRKKSKYKSGFERKKDAETWGIDTKRKLEGLSAGADEILLEDFLEMWIKSKKKKLSPSSYRGYKNNIKHINEYLGNTPLIKIRTIDIQHMIDSLRDGGLKYNAVKYIYRNLHTAMNYAVKTEMLDKNPCKGVEIAKDDEKFQAFIYDAENLRKLIFALREQEHYLYIPVLLASFRGLRRGECLGLRWSDIDFEKGVAYIRKQYIVEEGEKHFRKVKTDDSERVIDMTGFVAEELKLYKEKMKKAGNIQEFVCEKDGKLPDPSRISRALKNFQKANNLPLCRFHDLRHTFAVLQLEHGTDLDTLKRLLGHSKISITSDIYLHQNTTLIRTSSSKMDNIINLPTKLIKKEKHEMSQ